MTTTEIKPGIYKGMSNEAYHSGPGISKSGLWTIHTKTPAHYKYPAEKEMTPQKQANLDWGTGIHIAILEPNDFEKKVYRGPEDRKGNKWKDAKEFCELEGKLLLVQSAYDEVCAARDAVHADPWINSIITGGKPVIEASGYWIDEETGMMCRCRPDFYRSDLGVILDVKSTVDAMAEKFSRHVIDLGYHVQEPFYSDGWRALGQNVDAFVFLAVEKEAPFAKAVYELPPSIVAEGREIARKALKEYAECSKSGKWKSLPEGVQELKFPRWSYKNTEAPTALDEEVPA